MRMLRGGRSLTAGSDPATAFTAADRDETRIARWVSEALSSGEAPEAILASAQVRAIRFVVGAAGGYRTRDVDAFVAAIDDSMRYYEAVVTELVVELGETRAALADVQATVELLRTAPSRVLVGDDGDFVSSASRKFEGQGFDDVEAWLATLANRSPVAAGAALPPGWTVAAPAASANEAG